MSKSFAFKVLGDLALTFWGEASPSTADFQEALAAFEKRMPTRVCAITTGGGPSTIQRGQLNRLAKPAAQRTAIVCESESPALRGVITAYSWFNKDLKVFPASALHDALRYLDVSAAQFPEVRRELERLRDIVRPPPPLGSKRAKS